MLVEFFLPLYGGAAELLGFRLELLSAWSMLALTNVEWCDDGGTCILTELRRCSDKWRRWWKCKSLFNFKKNKLSVSLVINKLDCSMAQISERAHRISWKTTRNYLFLFLCKFFWKKLVEFHQMVKMYLVFFGKCNFYHNGLEMTDLSYNQIMFWIFEIFSHIYRKVVPIRPGPVIK